MSRVQMRLHLFVLPHLDIDQPSLLLLVLAPLGQYKRLDEAIALTTDKVHKHLLPLLTAFRRVLATSMGYDAVGLLRLDNYFVH